MIAALAIIAAIITEQNNLLTRTADAATFGEGSGGIASQWIPWGTYTAGTGGTEITRATSNLVGVVASVYDGFREREEISAGYEPVASDYKIIYLPVSTPPMYSWIDAGEYLATTRNTLRLVDALNSRVAIYYRQEGTNFEYWTSGGAYAIEEELARSWIYSGVYTDHDGLAKNFGGRKLDALVSALGGIDPPISTSWSSSIPFRTTDSAAWELTWPTYAALTNDIHFFPGETGTPLAVSFPWSSWIDPPTLPSFWGDDVREAADELVASATNSLPITMEDVLGVDTGWRYDVPARLTNDFWTVDGLTLKRSYIYPDDWEDFENCTYASWTCATNGNAYHIELEPGSWWYFAYDLDTGEYLFDLSTSAGHDAQELDFGGVVASKTEQYADADDYTSWRNMTTRLDWRRLGIICQLMRQMEETYQTRDGEDILPCVRQHATWTKEWEASTAIAFPVPSSIQHEETIDLSAIDWRLAATNAVSVTTNDLEWTHPIARADAPSFGAIVNAGSEPSGFNFSEGYPVLLTKNDLAELIKTCSGLQYIQGDASIKATIKMEVHNNPVAVSVQLVSCYEITDGGSTWLELGDSATQTLGVSDATNLVAHLHRYMHKEGTATWTHALQEETGAIVARMNAEAPSPTTNIWARGFVAQQTRPSLDFMIWTSGEGAERYAYTLDSMAWGDLVPTYQYQTGRAWRMNPATAPAATLQAGNNNRLAMLRDIDTEVKAKFRALSGISIDDIATRAQITAAEEAQLIANLNAKTIKATFELQPLNFRRAVRENYNPDYTPESFREDYGWNSVTNGEWWVYNSPWFIASLGMPSTDLSDMTARPISVKILSDDAGLLKPNGDILIAEAFWSLGEVEADTITNGVGAVSVDGHQDQMIRTLWRFKNLRDPDL